MSNDPIGWTIVRHNAFYTGHTEFTRAVETRSIATRREEAEVLKAGGLILPSYDHAEAFAEKANYPPDHGGGIIANCQGTFSDRVIDGLAIYIPVRGVVG